MMMRTKKVENGFKKVLQAQAPESWSKYTTGEVHHREF